MRSLIMDLVLMDLEEFPDYFAGDDGHIYSLRTARRWGREAPLIRLKEPRDASGQGYPRVFLRRDGRSHQIGVHVLVCTAFHGPCPPGLECSHLNDIKTDNRPANLCWETTVRNRARKVGNGISDIGTRNSRASLTESQVVEVRLLLAQGETTYAVAERLCVSRTTISRIKNGRRYQEEVV